MKALKIKVCGMRDPENTSGIGSLQPDFIGLIFYPKSPRYVGEIPDYNLIEQIDHSIKKVGVFVNEPIEKVIEITIQWKLEVVQLHGDETPWYSQQIKQTGILVIKAFSIDDSFNFSSLEAYEANCDYFLFDTKGKLPGGTGYKFNWQVLEKYHLHTPFFLSGGIKPEDINSLQNFIHPKWFGIDINSGFETKPGIKDIAKVQKLIEEIRK